MSKVRTRVVQGVLCAAGVALSFAVLPGPESVPGTPAPAYAACASEDGSTPGQAFPCVWDAARMGNGQGVSYVLTGSGDDILSDPAVRG